MASIVYVSNTNVIELIGLKSAIEDVYIDDADVEFTIKNASGVEITGQTWPTVMDYIVASSGDYRGIIKDVAALDADTEYVAVIDVDAGTDRIGHWEFHFKPRTRLK